MGRGFERTWQQLVAGGALLLTVAPAQGGDSLLERISFKKHKDASSCPAPAEAAPAPAPAPTAPAPAPAAEAPTLDALTDTASALDVASAPQSIAPAMIGDLFGFSNNFFFNYVSQNGNSVGSNVQTTLAGGRRFKISENVSPMPRDRVYVQYNFFKSAFDSQGVTTGNTPSGGFPAGAFPNQPITGTPVYGGLQAFNLNRYTFGLEKTFFDGMVSAEVRIPFSTTISNDITAGNTSIPGDEATQFDNVSATLKGLVFQNRTVAISTGVLVNTPTASSVTMQQNIQVVGDPAIDPLGLGFGDSIRNNLTVKNQAVHVSPFLGYLLTPTARSFALGYVQYDIPVSGNAVTFTPITQMASGQAIVGDTQRAVLTDQALLQADLSLGYWLYQNPGASFLTGFAPLVEVHYTTTLQNADILLFNQQQTASGGSQNLQSNYQGAFGNTQNRLDIWNLTLGAAIQVGQRLQIGNGFVIPLSRGNGNNLFDWEYTLQANYRFGAFFRGNLAPTVQ